MRYYERMLLSENTPRLRAVLHGSFRKHFGEIKRAHRLFAEAGIEVLAPAASEIASDDGGFARLESDAAEDPRLIELLYLHNLRRLGEGGFSYFVTPAGYIGKSASYELGIAQISNVRCFFSESLADHPAYLHKNSIWKAEDLAEYIHAHGSLPAPSLHRDEKAIHKLWEQLMVPGSVVAVGAIIEKESRMRDKELLFVKTHKWGGKYSMIGGKVRRNERLDEALVREIKEESGLRASIGKHICTFDQFKNSGYYLSGIQHIFVDKVVTVGNKKVQLNEEAEDYIWVSALEAIAGLPLEPNARHTLELYAHS